MRKGSSASFSKGWPGCGDFSTLLRLCCGKSATEGSCLIWAFQKSHGKWWGGQTKRGDTFKMSAITAELLDQPQTVLEAAMAGPRDGERGQPEIISTRGNYLGTCCCCWVASVMLDSLWPHGLSGVLSMRFSRQEYWSGLPCPSPGDLPDPGIKPMSPACPALKTDSLPLSHRESPVRNLLRFKKKEKDFPLESYVAKFFCQNILQ